jgi:hypothetical protein
LHGEGWRVRKAPILANALMQPLHAGLGGLKRQGLNRVGLEKLAGPLPLLRLFTNAGARRDNE